jgi:hypothetical protein
MVILDPFNKSIIIDKGDLSGSPGSSSSFYDWQGYAASDETSDLTVGTGVVEFQMPYAGTLQTIVATLTTAATGSDFIVDVNKNGATILSTKLIIDPGEKTSRTADTPLVISDNTLAKGDVITINIDQIGATVAGTGLKIYFETLRS